MADICEEKNHRKRALAKARSCTTCREHRDPRGHKFAKPEPCLGCKRVIDYYSCAPGYCVACAHDPCWVSVFVA